MKRIVFWRCLVLALSFWLLSPSVGTAGEGILGGIFSSVSDYVKEHRQNMDNILFERDMPVKFKRDIDLDRLYAPFDQPYSIAAVGLHYDSLSQFDRSAYFYDKAFRDALEKKEKPALSMVTLSIILSYQAAGELAEAFTVIDEISSVWDDDYAEWTKNVGRAYLFASIGDYEGAEKNLESAREHVAKLSEEEKDEFGALYLMYQIDKIQGSMDYVRGDYEEAIGSLKSAFDLAVLIGKSKNGQKMPRSFPVKLKLDVQIFLAMIDSAQGRVELAMQGMEQALEEAVKVKWPWGKAQATLFLGRIAYYADDPSASERLAHSLEIAQETQIPFFIWQSHYHRGRALLKEGKTQAAIDSLQQAALSIESLRSKISLDAQKTSFMGNKRRVYETLALALLESGEVETAFEVAEKAKSRALVDLLVTKQLSAEQANVDPELVQEEQELFAQIYQLRNSGEGLKVAPKIAQLEERYSAVLQQIKDVNPELASLKTVELASLADVQALLDEDTVILEFLQTKHELVAWLVGKDFIEVERIPLNRVTLAKQIKSVRIMIKKPKIPVVYKLLGKLDAAMIEPFAERVRDKAIIIVPDGALHYLPFAALQDSQGQFLAQRNPLYYCPSANVLKFCMDKKKGEIETILALGNPDLGDPVLDLPNAGLEAQAIATKFPDSTYLLLRDQVLETIAKKAMPHHDILHFACHGEMDPIRPLLSALLLVPDGVNDGRLQAGEIFDMTLKAQLVVLSGCETGLGKIASGDEIIGLTRGFLYAGAPAVMASLWKVDDAATSILMTTFYDNLSRVGKAEALRQAQIKTMETHKHPYYWASFFLVGDGK